jgi:hypothetical protein
MLPRHAGRIIRRCLAKDPDRRYQTALDLRNELEQLASEIDSGVHAVPPPGDKTPARRSRIPLVVGAVAVLGVALFLGFWLRDGADPADPLYEPRPVTLASALDRDVSWSPDGKFIAIERMVSGEKEIYVKAIDGGQAVARVELPGVQRSPRWTPDGRYLTFVSAHEPGNPIVLSPVEGGSPRRLVVTQIPTLDMDSGVMGDRPWADDGRTLLVAMPTENGFYAVHAVDGTTGEASQLTFPPGGSDDSHPTYSFDGEQILFRRVIDGRGALMLMAATGGDAEPLLQDEFNYHRGAWRPDNRRVVFKRSQQGGTAIENLFEIDVLTSSSWTRPPGSGNRLRPMPETTGSPVSLRTVEAWPTARPAPGVRSCGCTTATVPPRRGLPTTTTWNGSRNGRPTAAGCCSSPTGTVASPSCSSAIPTAAPRRACWWTSRLAGGPTTPTPR